MLKVNQNTLDEMERQHPGLVKTIMFFENATLPVCSQCGSDNTAAVNVGIVGQSIYLATATTKAKLVPNVKDKLGKYFCNECNKFFGEEQESERKGSGFTLRINLNSLQEYKDLVNNVSAQLGFGSETPMSEKEWENNWRKYQEKAGKKPESTVKKEKNKKKSTSTGSTSSNMKITLSACSPQVRTIFETLVNGWREVGGTVQCRRPSSIYLRIITKAHESGKNAQFSHNFNLVALRAPRGRQSAQIQVKWDSGKTINPSPYLDFAYLDCIPDVVTRFEKMVSSLPGFEQKGTIIIDKHFKPLHTKLLINGMKEVKVAEANAKRKGSVNMEEKKTREQQLKDMEAAQLMAMLGMTPEEVPEAMKHIEEHFKKKNETSKKDEE